MRYGFGRNWEDFIEHTFDEGRVSAARDHMLAFLKAPSLEGRSFLDVGSGSGLHSLAALRAGAAQIFSFDYDEDSVRTTRRLRARAGDPGHWVVERGSVVDADFMGSLAPADVVYSWGVLHHTGQMWTAVQNALLPLAADGVFYVALYTTDVFVRRTPEYWLRVKKRYNAAGPFRRAVMEWRYALADTIVPSLLQGRNPLPTLRGRGQGRGMTYWTDVRDWLGGWPMEFAGIAETKAFAASHGLELLNIDAGEANTEYLFRRRGTANYWDAATSGRVVEPLSPPFASRGGLAYAAALPHHRGTADDEEQRHRSRLMLFEDGVPVGFPHQSPRRVAAHGGGRYLHWKNELVFSATDGSDPNTNGRDYRIAATG